MFQKVASLRSKKIAHGGKYVALHSSGHQLTWKLDAFNVKKSSAVNIRFRFKVNYSAVPETLLFVNNVPMIRLYSVPA